MTPQVPQVNGERLWQSLLDMAQFGAIPKDGVTRLALSEEDRQARDQLRDWAKEAGCSVRVDRMGNMFLRREGTRPELAPVITGSHVDSQPNGGRFDGIYGVLAGLEVIRTLNDRQIATERAMEVVNWTNEEGARFAPAMISSGVFAGVFDLAYGLSRSDAQGISLGEALQHIGYAGEHPVGGMPIHAAFELHIEQGPILEAENIEIGVVTTAQGQRWYELEITGFSAHAGTTPMDRRRDALLGFATLVMAVNTIGKNFMPDARATVGMAQITPNSRNVVPGKVFFSIEFRHPQEVVLEQMEQQLLAAVAEVGTQGLSASAERIFQYQPIRFDQGCIDSVRQAALALGYSHRDMVSGAGHDACYLSRVAPTAMIFIPCVEGISHNELENISPAWATAGANVLLNALLAQTRA
ncbi:Zn-dependent hydrolase [Serratia proteamaculans]|jgi:N-carbamoyl-L-amino-acid hydrolase|uniref:Zn-dependent hydrolase n=1 Tax=Serratia proteamaculans TaxID=28151 RepID=A0A7U0N5P9_SERPR|nr:Zn-dependent hydrolase [Serratia proteamaculans]MBO1501691.1 Zn-dependent hydrolase [Serratia proteamaculans]MDW5508423.1 Zn-dependent hydrolase [Serratia proteamaculans]QQX52882.1 Zn-dependent hydrolase [Serratia proteamaculans]CAI2427525.1 N-carbamoyl-L-amino acid hydrolase [Serratia proteamaculans]